jgi:hypothetical protein
MNTSAPVFIFPGNQAPYARNSYVKIGLDGSDPIRFVEISNGGGATPSTT